MSVSVCIPTYNQAMYIEQAVRSAFNQSWLPIEIIVSDDKSTDNTLIILEELVKEVPILKIIKQQENVGIAGNTDKCLRAATGNYVVRLDSDDYLAPDYIAELARSLEEHPEAGYAHAAVQEIDQFGNFLRKRQLFRKSGFQAGTEALQAAIKGYRVAANIIMFRHAALRSVNYITGRPNYVEDYHLSTALAAAEFGNVYINKSLSFYRVWVDGAKVRQRRKLMEIVGLYRVFEEIVEPSYRIRNWSLVNVQKMRTAFACTHASCLSWSVYTTVEKDELATALRKLSKTPLAKLYIWLNLNGFGESILLFSKLQQMAVSSLKRLLLTIKTTEN